MFEQTFKNIDNVLRTEAGCLRCLQLRTSVNRRNRGIWWED